jgi:hypothetical protein
MANNSEEGQGTQRAVVPVMMMMMMMMIMKKGKAVTEFIRPTFLVKNTRDYKPFCSWSSFLHFLHLVSVSPLESSVTLWHTAPAPGDDFECGVVERIRIVRGSGSTRRKTVPLSLYSPQIPHHLISLSHRRYITSLLHSPVG